jgi:WhiB family redox-sensing transcriptional regulator
VSHETRYPVREPVGEWALRAACAGMDASIFFPCRGNAGMREAKTVCARCPVKQQCLDHAMAQGESEGIWGGLNASERERLGCRKPRVNYDIVCGTDAGYSWHRRHGEPACEPCLEAHRMANRRWKADMRERRGAA